MNTSRKAMECLICFCIVNLMLGCLLFKKSNESCSLSKASRMSSTDIVISKPNKGNGAVILDQKLYNKSIEEII